MIYHIRPIYKSFIWGGDKLKEYFELDSDLENIGTIYHVIAVKGELDNVVEETGECLSEFYVKHPELFDCTEKEFPIRMTTTCNEGLQSYQVHPDDDYAWKHEGKKGKVSGSFTIEESDEIRHRRFGHKCRDLDEFKHLVETKDWDNLFQFMDVKTGDFVHTPAGVIHGGKGDGKISCTFGTNGDITYRFYDFDRNDAKRPLNLQETYDLIQFPEVPLTPIHAEPVLKDGLEIYEFYDKEKEYVAKRIKCEHKGVLACEDFLFLACIGGEGSIDGIPIKKGETVFIPAHYKEVEIEGTLDLIFISYH